MIVSQVIFSRVYFIIKLDSMKFAKAYSVGIPVSMTQSKGVAICLTLNMSFSQGTIDTADRSGFLCYSLTCIVLAKSSPSGGVSLNSRYTTSRVLEIHFSCSSFSLLLSLDREDNVIYYALNWGMAEFIMH